MTFRSDVTIDWASSPRLIKVAAPSTSITCQDIVDTCRQLEAELGALDDEPLINEKTGGKIEAGTITTVIVLVLNNAKIKFDDRPGPDQVRCDIIEGTIGAVDDVGDPMDPREPAAFVDTSIAQATTGAIMEGSGGGLTPEEHDQLMATALQSALDIVDGKVDVIDGKLDIVDGKLDVIDGVVDGISVSVSTIQTDVGDLTEIVLQNRKGNRLETYSLASVQVPERKVAVGKVNRRNIKWKRTTDPDFTSPVAEVDEYAWFLTLGDSNPYKWDIDDGVP